ncbi:1866_t:CDS:2 [Funneliformis geosporum]|uniref:1866_t:CDS:1 n=1 Tax=Funneliformis geosporum TaxID=1117311 RepID=A0A9W4WHP0_9GLOM|nr:1866_t:CDS:2 [Funneliformis geosporum]
MSSSIRNSSETTLQGETTSITTSIDHTTKINESQNPPNTLPVLKVSPTCNFADLPLWLQDNCYILRGYRRPTFCYRKCAKSLFYIHNESGFSSIFHTLCCHSERVCANWNRCDYVGIVTLIVGSFYPMIYYGFYCHSTLQIIYLSMISIFGAATISVAVSSRFRSPQYRWFRTGLFLAMGLSAFVPLVHAVIIYGIQLCFDVISLKWLLLMGALYVLGAVIYGASNSCTCTLLWSNASNGILA